MNKSKSSFRLMALCIATLGLLLVCGSCDDDKKPSYKELQEQNEELESQLSQVKEDISDAKSQLDDLRTEINNMPECEDNTEMDSHADDVENTLDKADEDSD